MWELILMGAKKPHIPMLLGVGLYIWIALGCYLIKKPALGGMWLMYAFANAFMAWHILRE